MMSKNEPEVNNRLDLDELDVVSGGGRAGWVEDEGVIVDVLPDNSFKVEFEDGNVILCRESERLCSQGVQLYVGQRVRLEINVGDGSQAFIIRGFRH